jgi:hypothetical protein
VAEQRYQAVMSVIADGLSISQAAEKGGCVASNAAMLRSIRFGRTAVGYAQSFGKVLQSDARQRQVDSHFPA